MLPSVAKFTNVAIPAAEEPEKSRRDKTSRSIFNALVQPNEATQMSRTSIFQRGLDYRSRMKCKNTTEMLQISRKEKQQSTVIAQQKERRSDGPIMMGNSPVHIYKGNGFAERCD